MVLRMTTLMLSRPPSVASMSSDSKNEVDRPNTMVARPKPVTASRSVMPALRNGGRCASTTAMSSAPTDGAARIRPSPSGPTFRMSVA